jgi:hypothetical protein
VFAFGDRHHARRSYLRATDEVIYLVFLKQKLDALGHLARHAARTLHDFGEIKTHVFYGNAVSVGLFDFPEKLRALQQRLGRDTAPVKARAARALHLDARDFLAELSGADRTRVARWVTACPEDGEHVFVIRKPCEYSRLNL